MDKRRTEPGQVFARRMRYERMRVGISQAALAEGISRILGYKVDSSSVTRIETGERGLRLEEAIAIAEELGLPVAALLRDRQALDEEIDQLREDLALAEWRAAKAQDELREAQEAVRGIRSRIAELETERGD